MPSNLDEITNPGVAYLRLHGRNARAYITGKTVAARFNYDYNNDEIAGVAKRSKRLAHEAREVHIVFNNNALDYAPRQRHVYALHSVKLFRRCHRRPSCFNLRSQRAIICNRKILLRVLPTRSP